jgi:hypothetical protein
MNEMLKNRFLAELQAKSNPNHVSLNGVLLAPGVGLEPARPRRATGLLTRKTHIILFLRLKACALSTLPSRLFGVNYVEVS